MIKKSVKIFIICAMLFLLLFQTALAIPTDDEYIIEYSNNYATGWTTSAGQSDYICCIAYLRDGSTILESDLSQDWDWYYSDHATAHKVSSNDDNAKGIHRWVIDNTSHYEVTYD